MSQLVKHNQIFHLHFIHFAVNPWILHFKVQRFSWLWSNLFTVLQNKRKPFLEKRNQKLSFKMKPNKRKMKTLQFLQSKEQWNFTTRTVKALRQFGNTWFIPVSIYIQYPRSQRLTCFQITSRSFRSCPYAA